MGWLTWVEVMRGHTMVLVSVVENENPSDSRIVHRRSNMGSCEEPKSYVVMEEEFVFLAAHGVYRLAWNAVPTIMRWRAFIPETRGLWTSTLKILVA